MKAHVVVAHPEPQSFNLHLASLAKQTLIARGWDVSVSDLYAMAFDPCGKSEHYASRADSSRFVTQSEQRHASANGTIPGIVQAEIDRLEQAPRPMPTTVEAVTST